MARRLEGSRLVWLLLGSLVPLVFVLDWIVGRDEGQGLQLDAQVQIQADGQDPWVLAVPMQGLIGEVGLSIAGRAPLRTPIYPWLETPYEAELMLALSPELMEQGPGVYEQGFSVSLRTWDMRRADGLGTPALPCQGRVEIRELEFEGPSVAAAHLELDMLCTSAGPDLRWRSGDEHVWALSGPVRLAPSAARASAPHSPQARDP